MWLCRDSSAGALGWLTAAPVTLQCGRMGIFMGKILLRNSAQHSTHPTGVGPGKCHTSRTLAGSLALPGWRWLSWSGNDCGNLGHHSGPINAESIISWYIHGTENGAMQGPYHQSGPRNAESSPSSAFRGCCLGQGQWPWARWVLSP